MERTPVSGVLEIPQAIIRAIPMLEAHPAASSVIDRWTTAITARTVRFVVAVRLPPQALHRLI